MSIARSESLYRPLRLGAITALSAFGLLATIAGVSGLGGGVGALVGLGSLSVAAGIVMFIRTRRRFSHSISSGGALMAPSEELGVIVRRELGSHYGSAFDQLIQQYRTEVARLQDQLRGCRLTEDQAVIVPAAGPIRCFEPSRPATEAEYPGAFQIDQVLVTNRAFEEFLLDSPEWCPDEVTARYGVPYFLSEFIDGHPPPDKWDHPVVWVSWYAAVAYCNWRSRRAGYRLVYSFEDDHRVVTDLSANGWRLPTVTEWETAAHSGEAAELPIDPTRTNYGLHYRGTTAVGRFRPFPPSAVPVYDVLGNVKQWCQDADVQRSSHRAFKGASWMDDLKHLRVDTTGSLPPQNTNPDFGFRCVRVPFGEANA